MKQQQKELLREILASARIDLSEKCKDVTKQYWDPTTEHRRVPYLKELASDYDDRIELISQILDHEIKLLL